MTLMHENMLSMRCSINSLPTYEGLLVSCLVEVTITWHPPCVPICALVFPLGDSSLSVFDGIVSCENPASEQGSTRRARLWASLYEPSRVTCHSWPTCRGDLLNQSSWSALRQTQQPQYLYSRLPLHTGLLRHPCERQQSLSTHPPANKWSQQPPTPFPYNHCACLPLLPIHIQWREGQSSNCLVSRAQQRGGTAQQTWVSTKGQIKWVGAKNLRKEGRRMGLFWKHCLFRGPGPDPQEARKIKTSQPGWRVKG